MRQRGDAGFFRSHGAEETRSNLEAAALAWIELVKGTGDADHDEDVDDIAAEMARMGASAEKIAAFRAASYEDEDAGADDGDAEDVEVLPQNIDAVEVFCACTWRHHVAQDGSVIPMGIDAVEIKAVAEMLGIKRRDWPRVIPGVRVMEATARPYLRR